MLHALQDEAKYLVFDGDVDAVWVENMNSVMDDNKLLTLPNGERIRLQPHCRLLFEVYAQKLLSPDSVFVVFAFVLNLSHRHAPCSLVLVYRFLNMSLWPGTSAIIV